MTYEGLSAAYSVMTGGDSAALSVFIDRMNTIPKYVASNTLRETRWNANVIDGDVASFVADLKQRPGGNIIKYGNGPLDKIRCSCNSTLRLVGREDHLPNRRYHQPGERVVQEQGMRQAASDIFLRLDKRRRGGPLTRTGVNSAT